MSNEIWRDVVGFEESYQVSNIGRVRSKDRLVAYSASLKCGAYLSPRKGRVLKPAIGSHGYFTVMLGRKNCRTIHSLVANAFIGPCPDGHEVLHADGTRTNNCVNNLRYGTRSENMLDAVKHGTCDLVMLKAAADKGRASRWGAR
jgi:hypothetical protein